MKCQTHTDRPDGIKRRMRNDEFRFSPFPVDRRAFACVHFGHYIFRRGIKTDDKLLVRASGVGMRAKGTNVA